MSAVANVAESLNISLDACVSHGSFKVVDNKQEVRISA
jgi:hypothetical protein